MDWIDKTYQIQKEAHLMTCEYGCENAVKQCHINASEHDNNITSHKRYSIEEIDKLIEKRNYWLSVASEIQLRIKK